MKKRIIFLYSSLNGFVVSTLRALISTDKVESVNIIYWDKNKTSGNLFKYKNDERIQFLERSKYDNKKLLELLNEQNPDIIYISGWMDRGYLSCLRKYRKENKRVITVCGLDDQWRGTLRQRLGKLYYRAVLRGLFDRIWVSGSPQYHFARNIGYCDTEILFNLLSADTTIFKPTLTINKRFVYVGRLEHQKGVDTLISAYEMLPVELRRQWPLYIIGDGTLRAGIEENLPFGVTLFPYMQPDALALELEKGGVGCQPSRFEQWGVSIHELASLGFPLIVSTACGAATEFVIEDFNGYHFPKESPKDIVIAMQKCIGLPDEELLRLSKGSKILGSRISPEMAAYSLLSADAVWRRAL